MISSPAQFNNAIAALPPLKLFIGGQWVDSDSNERIDVVNPATGELLASIPHASASDVNRAVESARKAWDGWRLTPPFERAAICHRIADRILARKEQIATVISLEQGKYYWNLQAMKAALAARVHYLDLGGLFYTTRKQLKLNSAFRSIGKLAILGIGSAPGTANVMARFLADQLHRVRFIRVYNGSRDIQSYSDPLSFGFSIATILDELTIPPIHFVKGRFESRERFSGAEPITFPKPIGKLIMRHSIHSEVATLPVSFKSKGIQEAFFKINYDPKLIEVTELLARIGLLEQKSVNVGGQQVSPRALLEHLLKLRPQSNKIPKDIETIRVVVQGWKDGRARTISMDATTRYTKSPALSAVARDTGYPISVAAQMISAREITAIGVHAPETSIPPREFLARLHRRGIRISGSGWR